MAFDKEEVNQLEKLFETADKKTDEKFLRSERRIDEKFYVSEARFDKKLGEYFKKSEKKTYEIVCEAIDQVVMPQFDRMYERMDMGFESLDKKIEKTKLELKSDIKYEIAKVKEDIAKLEDKLE